MDNAFHCDIVVMVRKREKKSVTGSKNGGGHIWNQEDMDLIPGSDSVGTAFHFQEP